MSDAAAPAPRSLLDPRLVIVTGKGGTGKTTVAATLALAAARAGQRVLVAEVGRDEQIPRLLRSAAAADAPVEPVGYAGRELLPGLRAMRIDPFAALAEYFSLQIGARGVVDRVVRNRAFAQLMNAAPGWRELITLGKVWHLEQLRDASGEPQVDLIVVDAPATGHGLTFLDVPRVVSTAVRRGPLRRHAEAVEALLRDPVRTLLLPVALPEELPVRETTELVARLQGDIGIAVDRVVANAVEPPPIDEALGDALDEALAAAAAQDAALEQAGLPHALELRACLRHRRARRRLHEHHLEELARATALPLVVLPCLPGSVRGLEDCEQLAPLLLAPPRRLAATPSPAGPAAAAGSAASDAEHPPQEQP